MQMELFCLPLKQAHPMMYPIIGKNLLFIITKKNKKKTYLNYSKFEFIANRYSYSVVFFFFINFFYENLSDFILKNVLWILPRSSVLVCL